MKKIGIEKVKEDQNREDESFSEEIIFFVEAVEEVIWKKLKK